MLFSEELPCYQTTKLYTSANWKKNADNLLTH